METHGPLLTLIFFLTALSFVNCIPHEAPSLHNYVEAYLTNGGHERLRKAFNLPPGILYNPLYSLTREDIPLTHPDQQTSSDLDLLRAMRLHVPGLDSIRQIEARADDDECIKNTPTIVTGASAMIRITYTDSTPSIARSPVDHAVQQWADVFQSDVPIKICFRWSDELHLNTLGATSTGFVARSNEFPELRADAFYSPAMAVAKLGREVLPDSEWHLSMVLNRNIDWHYDTRTRAPFRKFDLATTVLHELTHGLFFSGTIKAVVQTQTATFSEGTPGQFDMFMQVGSVGVARSCRDPKDLYAALTNPTLRIVDESALLRFELYSPAQFESGSSGYHFNNFTFERNCEEEGILPPQCSDLMTHQLGSGYTQRVIGEPTLRVYRALRNDGEGVAAGEVCELPDVPHPVSDPVNSAAGSGERFQFPTWGVWTVAAISGVGSTLVVGVVVSSIISRRGNR